MGSSTSEQMQVQMSHLSNGMAVHCLSQPWLTHSAVCLRVFAGSHDEPPEYPGMAHFLEHMLFLGGAQFVGEQRLMPFVQACGGQLNASTQARYTDYFFELPSQQLEAALVRLLDMLAAPRLALDEQLREREVIEAEFLARSQDRITLISSALGQSVCAQHPYQRFVAGQRSSLPVEDDVFQQALRTFYSQHYVAANCRLSVVGPEPVAYLQALIRRTAGLLARAIAPVPQASLPALQWQYSHLQLQLPNAAPALHLAFSLTLANETDQAAWAFIEHLLLQPHTGGLSAELQAQGWAQSISAQRLYQHADQGLWLVSLQQVAEPQRALACVLDALHAWQRHAAPASQIAAYAQQRRYQRQALGPLARARAGLHHECLPTQASVQQLLAQLQSTERLCLLHSCTEAVPLWPTQGFRLHLRVEPAWTLEPYRGQWSGPHLAELKRSPPQRLAVSAQLDWLVLDAAAMLSGMACCKLHWRLALVRPVEQVLGIAQQRLQTLIKTASCYGVEMQWRTDGCALELTIKGPREVLPKLLQPLVQQLSAPWLATPRGHSVQADLPIRHLLEHSDCLMGVLKPVTDTRLQPMKAEPRLSLLGAGFTLEQQAHMEAMFDGVSRLQAATLVGQAQAGLHWRHLAFSGEAALLVFCPQPAFNPHDEAVWRVLGQRLQSRFYQRLRSELQLGYAVFCAYRQLQGRRGLLFGVQSGKADAQALLQHIRQFLECQMQPLDAQDVAADVAALQLQRQCLSPEQHLQQAWQDSCAGVPAAYAVQVNQALTALEPHHIQAGFAHLCAPSAAWYVISNQPCSRPLSS